MLVIVAVGNVPVRTQYTNDLTDVEIWTDRETMATNIQSSLVDPVGEIFKTRKIK